MAATVNHRLTQELVTRLQTQLMVFDERLDAAIEFAENSDRASEKAALDRQYETRAAIAHLMNLLSGEA